jgi:hypothetical protein
MTRILSKSIRRRRSSQSDRYEKFQALTARWRENTAFLSNPEKIYADPSYREIVSMGRDALPLILFEMREHPDHWFDALRTITGVNPIKSEHRGNMREMTSDWLRWAERHGWGSH